MKVAFKLHFNNYDSSGLIQNLSSLKAVHVKFSFWFLFPLKSSSQRRARAAPQAPGFCGLPSSHSPHLSKQLIQHRSLVCQPLVRSKGLFCSVSLRALPSLFPLLPSADRPAFPSHRAFPLSQRDCERERHGLLAGYGSELHPAPLTGPGASMVTQAGTWYPRLESFLQLRTPVLLFTKSDNVLFFLFTLCSLHRYKCNSTKRTIFPYRDFSTWACMGW